MEHLVSRKTQRAYRQPLSSFPHRWLRYMRLRINFSGLKASSGTKNRFRFILFTRYFVNLWFVESGITNPF